MLLNLSTWFQLLSAPVHSLASQQTWKSPSLRKKKWTVGYHTQVEVQIDYSSKAFQDLAFVVIPSHFLIPSNYVHILFKHKAFSKSRSFSYSSTYSFENYLLSSYHLYSTDLTLGIGWWTDGNHTSAQGVKNIQRKAFNLIRIGINAIWVTIGCYESIYWGPHLAWRFSEVAPSRKCFLSECLKFGK